MSTLAAAFARFIVSLDATTLPAEVEEKARVCLLNGLGIGLDCHATPYAAVAREAVIAMDGEIAAGATLLGDGRRTTIGGACIANGALFHGRAQEDASGAAHLGTILIPLLVAMIEVRRYPLDRLLPSLVAGYEVGGVLEQTYAGQTTPAGFRSTATYGVIAAAAAAARMMALSQAQTAAALANAVSFTGGVLQSFADGTDEWRYQPGVIARNGLTAAELARCGSVSAPHAIEGKAGLIAAFARTGCDVAGIAEGLGRRWNIHRVAFKPYPVCAFNQTPVTAALELRRVRPDADWQSVAVRMNPYECGYAGMDARGPFSTISGTLMSIPFCIATTLRHGVPDMKRMTTYDDADVNALVERIELVSDDAVPVLSCVIEAQARDGERRVLEQRMTAQDYNYDRAQVSALVRRIGKEQHVPEAAFAHIERFVEQLPAGRLDDVLSAFDLLP